MSREISHKYMSANPELLPTFGFTKMLHVATVAMDRYRQEHPKWWRRKIDGTPIDNDLPVIMAEEFRDYVDEQLRANRWAAFSDEDLDEIMDHLPDNDLSQEIHAELARRKKGAE